MQSITIPANPTAATLHALCQSNGINIRTKQAKSKYIAAIEAFNAAIGETVETAIESDFSQGLIEATEISTARFIAPIVTVIVTTAIAVGHLLTCPRALAVYRDTLIGFVLAMVWVYESGQSCRDRYGATMAQAIGAAFVTVRTQAIKRTAIVAARIVTRFIRFDWYGITVNLLARAIVARRSLVANGNLWAMSQGAIG